MTAPATSIAPRRRASWAGFRRRCATTAAVSACLFSTLLTAVLAGTSHTQVGSGYPGLIALGSVLSTAAAVLLVWRHRWPWWVWGLAVAAPLLGETDGLAALVALVALLRVAPWGRACAAVAVTWLAASVSLVWDAHRGDSWSALQSWRGVQPRTATGFEIVGWVPWVVALVLVAVTTGVGLLLRTRSDLTVAVDRGDRATADQRQLREEVVRAQERARIARDLHDSLANRLTRISLLAGGLQARFDPDGADPAVAHAQESAELIRGAAHEAMGELKSAVGMLRTAPREPEPQRDGLAAVPALVEAARRAGVHVVLTVDLSTARLAPGHDHVAFRVAQEGLTNVQKHAVSAGARVTVRGGPGAGVQVEVANPVPGRAAAPAAGLAAGLVGLQEQVAAVGGRVGSGVEPGPSGAEFVLRGWVPWSG